MDYLNIEFALGLHERLEILYVVTGWQATFYSVDGDHELFSIHGESFEDLLFQLNEKLEDYER